ncbi:MAG TPA: tetratricopeptide repeat-containing glycosyltransferase family protein [Gemmataceae bacterium]|jgi:hypothetical protein
MPTPLWFSLALEADRLLVQGRLDDAAARAAASLELNPDSAVALYALGMVAWHRGNLEEGMGHLRRAIALCPDMAAAHNGLGLCLARSGDYPGALRQYEVALILKPDYAPARFNRALELLRLGRYAEGWVEYEWRWAAVQGNPPDIPRPKWDGSPLNGRGLLVHTEQGIGDVLLFLRFLPRVKRGPGDRLVFACQKALQPLLRHVPWVDEWFPIDAPAAVHFDVVTPMGSLPGLFRMEEADVRCPAAYLPADPALVEAWRPRVAALPGLKVGIIWQGNPSYHADRFRSIPLGQFAPLAAVPGVTLVSLQKGPGEEQIAANRGAVPVVVFPDLDAAAPFVDTAAVMQHLDLVITPETAIAHLAGALGRPLWVALGVDCDWRWGIGRADSPWHPTARLFRQRALGDWPGVITEMAAALRARIGSEQEQRTLRIDS